MQGRGSKVETVAQGRGVVQGAGVQKEVRRQRAGRLRPEESNYCSIYIEVS